MRCFIAVDLDASLKTKITAFQDQIKNLDVKLVEKNNLHFTLKFLGDISDGTVEKVKEKLAEIASLTPSFSITLTGIGVFPNENFIRVVWIGSEGNGFLNLHNAVNDALSALFKKEKASPHLTIARVRSQKDNKKILDFVNHHRKTEVGHMAVSKIKLKKSTLTREGPIYEDVAEFELKSD